MTPPHGGGLEPADQPIHINNPADLLAEHEALNAAHTDLQLDHARAEAERAWWRQRAERAEEQLQRLQLEAGLTEAVELVSARQEIDSLRRQVRGLAARLATVLTERGQP